HRTGGDDAAGRWRAERRQPLRDCIERREAEDPVVGERPGHARRQLRTMPGDAIGRRLPAATGGVDLDALVAQQRQQETTDLAAGTDDEDARVVQFTGLA